MEPTKTFMVLFFLINGNPDDPKGNAMPKIRLTRNQQWTKKAKMYQAWKRYVTTAFAKAHPMIFNKSSPDGQALAHMINPLALEKPITVPKGQRIKMDIVITWKNEKHGDPENVFGSIADALFEDDKNLAGSFDFKYGREGSVEVVITI